MSANPPGPTTNTVKGCQIFTVRSHMQSPFSELVNVGFGINNNGFKVPDTVQVSARKIPDNEFCDNIDLVIQAKFLADAEYILVKGKDTAGQAFEQQIHGLPQMRISSITQGCQFDLAMTAFEMPDGTTDLVNNGVITAASSQGKIIEISPDYGKFPDECPTYTQGVKKVFVRDFANPLGLLGQPFYLESSTCTISADMACTNADPTTPPVCTENGVTLENCRLVLHDIPNDQNVVARCDVFELNTGYNTACTINQLPNNVDPTFDNHKYSSELVPLLSGFSTNDQYFTLPLETVAAHGNYFANGVTLYIFSLLVDSNDNVVSHRSQIKIAMPKRLDPIQIVNPNQEVLGRFDGSIKIPQATYPDQTLTNCPDGLKAHLCQMMDGISTPQKITTVGKSTAGDGQFLVTDIFDYYVAQAGKISVCYELVCGNDVYQKVHPKDIDFIIPRSQFQESLPCGLSPVLYSPNGHLLHAPFKFQNLLDWLPEIGNSFFLTLDTAQAPNCQNQYKGEVVYKSLQAIPYMPCVFNNLCIEPLNPQSPTTVPIKNQLLTKDIVRYCSSQKLQNFSCGDYSGQEDNTPLTCTYKENLQDPGVDKLCTSFRFTDPAGFQHNVPVCQLTMNEASSCYITKYDNSQAYAPSSAKHEEEYYNEASMQSASQDGISFSLLMGEYKARMNSNNQDPTNPYMHVIFKTLQGLSYHRVQIGIEGPLTVNFDQCTLDRQKRSDNAQNKNHYFSEFNQQIGNLEIGTDVVIPPMSCDNCYLQYGIAYRGFCGLHFIHQDRVSSDSETKIGSGDIIKFILEEAQQGKDYYYALRATGLGNNGYFTKDYEHEMVKLGSMISSDPKGDQTDKYEIQVTISIDGNSLRNDLLQGYEIVLGEHANPDQVEVQVVAKIYPFPETYYSYEFINAVTIKQSIPEENAPLRLIQPEIYGPDPSAFVPSDQLDCTVTGATVECFLQQQPVENCVILKGIKTDGSTLQLGGCCNLQTGQCLVDLEGNQPNAITVTDTLKMKFLDPFNQLIYQAPVMYGENQNEITFKYNLQAILDTQQAQAQQRIWAEEIYLGLTTKNAQTGEAVRHKLQSKLIFNNDPCPQTVVANREALQNALQLSQPIKQYIKWNKPIEFQGTILNGYTLVATVGFRTEGNCNEFLDIACPEKELIAGDSILYEFSAAKTCIDQHDTQANGKYYLRVQAKNANNQVEQTYLTEIELLYPKEDDRKRGTCYQIQEKLQDSTGALKNPNYAGVYEMELNGADDATVKLQFGINGLDQAQCKYEPYDLMLTTYRDPLRGSGKAGYKYPSQCRVGSPLECFDDPHFGKFCEYEGRSINGCEQRQLNGIDYVFCEDEDEFGNYICGIWLVNPQLSQVFKLQPEAGLQELGSVFNGAAQPVFNQAQTSYTFTAANILTMVTNAQIQGDLSQKFYVQIIMKNTDSGELQYTRISLTIMFYSQGTTCDIMQKLAQKPMQQGLVQEATSNFIAIYQTQKLKVHIIAQSKWTLQVECFSYSDCAFHHDTNYDRQIKTNEGTLQYTDTEALQILSKDDDCFFKYIEYDAQDNETGFSYINKKIHLQFPADGYLNDGTSFSIGLKLGTVQNQLNFEYNLNDDPTVQEITLQTIVQPATKVISDCVFSVFPNLQVFNKLSAQRPNAYDNSCHRVYEPNLACDQTKVNCQYDGNQLTGCKEVTDKDSNIHVRCPSEYLGVSTCVIFFSTVPSRKGIDMFTPLNQEILAKSPYNDLLGNVEQKCHLNISLPQLLSLFERQPYVNPKVLTFYASYLVTEDDGTEVIVQKGPVTISFTRPAPPVSTDPANFIVSRFNKLIPFNADETELEVEIEIVTSQAIFANKEMVLTIAMYKDDNPVLQYKTTVSTYSGTPFTYAQILQHAGPILVDSSSDRPNVFFRLIAADFSTENVIATLDSDVLILLPPKTVDPGSCFMSSVTFDIDNAQIQTNGYQAYVKETSPASDGNPPIHENIKVTFGQTGQNCATTVHQCILLPTTDAGSLGVYSQEIYYQDAFCQFLDPTDSANEYTPVPGGQGLVRIKDSEGNVRLGELTPKMGYQLFRDRESGYCAVVSTSQEIMGNLKQAFGMQKSQLLEHRTLQGFAISDEPNAYLVKTGETFADYSGMVELNFHCVSAVTTTTQQVTTTTLHYSVAYASVIYETSVKVMYDESSQMIHYGKDLYLNHASLTPFYAIVKSYQIEALYLALYNHEDQTYTKFDDTKKDFNPDTMLSNEKLMTYEQVLRKQSTNVGFYELPEYAKYDLMRVLILRDTVADQTEEFLLNGDVVAMPPYIAENSLVASMGFDIVQQGNDRGVQKVFDQFDRPTFYIFDVQGKMNANFNVKLDITAVTGYDMIGFHLNNRDGLYFYCENSYRWQQSQEDSQCIGYPDPNCMTVNFDKNNCDMRLGTCDTFMGQLQRCQEYSVTNKRSFIKCWLGSMCVTQPVPLTSTSTQQLFVLGDMYNYVTPGEKVATTTFIPNDVQQYFNVPEGQPREPFYTHTLFKKAIPNTDPVEYSYHYAILEFMLLTKETVIELTMEYDKTLTDPNNPVLELITDPKKVTTRFDKSLLIKGTILETDQIDNANDWKLSGGIIERYQSQGTTSLYYFQHQFANGNGGFEVTITPLELIKHVGFNSPEFGFAARSKNAAEPTSFTKRDAFILEVTPPANGDKATDKACLTYDVTMFDVRGQEDGKEADKVIPLTFGPKLLDIKVKNECQGAPVYKLERIEISLEDDLTTTNIEYANEFFLQHNRPFIPEGATQEAKVLIEQIRYLRQSTSQDVLNYKIHALYSDENDDVFYTIRDLAIDFTTLGTPDQSYTCTVDFTYFHMYVAHNYNNLNTHDVDSDCDSLTGKTGGRCARLGIPFNTPLVLQLVPELAQCQGNTQDFLKDQNGIPYFDWEAAKNSVFANKGDVYTRVRTGWYIPIPGCDPDQDNCISVDQDTMSVTLSPVQQIHFSGGYDAYPKSTVLQLCNKVFMKQDCILFYMPPMEAPFKLESTQFTDFIQMTRAREDQAGTIVNIPIEPVNGIYEIDTSYALTFTPREGSCPQPLDAEFRTFDDLALEDDMRGRGIEGRTQNLDCEIIPLRSVNNDNQAPYEDANFKQYNDCSRFPTQNSEDVMCFEKTKCGVKKCYIKSKLVKHPQDSEQFKHCYDKDNFHLCPVSGHCVACRAASKADPDSCVEPDKVYAQGDCPPDKSGDCEEYYEYMDQVRQEQFMIDNSAYEPMSNLNKLLRDAQFTEKTVTYRPYVQAAEYLYYGNSHNGAIPPMPGNDFPRAEKNVYAHVICARTDESVEYKVQRFTFTEKQQPSNQGEYGIRMNFHQQFQYYEPLSISPGIIAPDNNYFLTAEFKDEYGSDPISTTNVFDAFVKYALISYRRISPYFVTLLLEAQGSVMAREQARITIVPPKPQEKVTNGPFAFPRVEMRQNGKLMTRDQFSYRVYSMKPIEGRLWFEDDNGSIIGRVADIVNRNFPDLIQECAYNHLCPPPQNDFCTSIPMYCLPVDNKLVCYDQNMQLIEGQCHYFDDGCSADIRCDMITGNASTEEYSFYCKTAQEVSLDNSPDFVLNHALYLKDSYCAYTAQQTDDEQNPKCPLTKACMTEILAIQTQLMNFETPDTFSCFKQVVPVTRDMTCNNSKEREKINELLDDHHYFQVRLQQDGSAQFTINPDAWKDLEGTHEQFYLSVFFQNGQGEMQYTTVMDDFLFLTYSDEITYAPEVIFDEKEACAVVPFGSPYDIAVQIENYPGTTSGYQIQELIEGRSQPKIHQHGDTASLNYLSLYTGYGGIKPYSTCDQPVVTFNVFDRNQIDFKKSPARLTLKYPEPADMRDTKDNPDPAGDPLPCNTITPALKDLNGNDVGATGNVPIINIDKEIIVEFTHNFDACNADGFTRTPMQVIISKNQNLHTASKSHRQTYNQAANYDCDIAVFHAIDASNCLSLRGGTYPCTEVTDNSTPPKSTRIATAGRSCFIKHEKINHPLDPNSGADQLKQCYTPGTTCYGDIDTNCMLKLAYEENPSLNTPDQAILDLQCQRLDSILREYEEANSQCFGNMNPKDLYDFGGPPNEMIEKYLRSTVELADKDSTKALKLKADTQRNFPTGATAIYIHTIYEKSKLNAQTGLVEVTMEYMQQEVTVNFYRRNPTTQSSISYNQEVEYGDPLNVKDDLSTSDQSAQQTATLELLDTNADCPLQVKTQTFQAQNGGTSRTASVTYRKLIQCYRDEMRGSGMRARANVTISNQQGVVQSGQVIQFEVKPPTAATSYQDCNTGNTDQGKEPLTVTMKYKQDNSPITVATNGFELTNANKDKGAILITLSGKQNKNFDSYVTYAVGNGALDSYTTGLSSDFATPESLYCATQTRDQVQLLICYNMDKSQEYDKCETNAGCTKCMTKQGLISDDKANPHPQEVQDDQGNLIYEACYTPGQYENCPVIPYCLDKTLYPADVFTNQILLSYPLLDIVDTFGLRQAYPAVPWDDLNNQYGGQSIEQRKALLAAYCIDLAKMVIEQESHWYKPCEELEHRTKDDQYHPLLREFFPSDDCGSGSTGQNNQSPTIRFAMLSVGQAVVQDSSDNDETVLELDEDFIQFIRSDPASIPASPNTVDIQLMTIGEKAGATMVCRNEVKFEFEAPGIELKLEHPKTRNGGEYTTLDYYPFIGKAVDNGLNSNNQLSCYFVCDPSDLCPARPATATTTEQFYLIPEDFQSINTPTQAYSLEYKCQVNDPQTIVKTDSHTITFEKHSYDEVCDIWSEEDYYFYYDEGQNGDIKIFWVEEQNNAKCTYLTAVMKIRETGTACSFCGVTGRNNIKTARNENDRKYIAISASDVTLNVIYNIDLEITYSVTINGNSSTKKAVVSFTIERYKPITFSFNLNGYQYFKGDPITNAIVASDPSVTKFSIVGWHCPNWLDVSICNSLGTSVSFSGSALTPYNIPTGVYEFYVQILYNGVADYYAYFEFSYVNENAGTSSQKAIKIEIEYPASADKESMKNTDIDFKVTSLTGTAADIFAYISYAWKLLIKNSAGQCVDFDAGSSGTPQFIEQDVYGSIPTDNLSPDTRYCVEVMGTLENGSTNTNRLEFKTSGILTKGIARLENMTPGQALTSTSNLRLRLEGFQGLEGAEIIATAKGQTGAGNVVAQVYETISENVRLPSTDNFDLSVHLRDGNGWYQDISITDSIAEGTPFADLDQAAQNQDFGDLGKKYDELGALYGNDAVLAKIKQELIANFQSEKQKTEIEANVKDLKKIVKFLEKLLNVIIYFAEDTDVISLIEAELLNTVDDALNSATQGSDKLREEAVEKIFEIQAELEFTFTASSSLRNNLNKKIMAYINQRGAVTINKPTNQMTAKSYDMASMRGTGTITMKQSSTGSLGESEVSFDASKMKQKASNVGATKLTTNVNCKAPSTKAIDAINDGIAYLNKQIEILISDGTSIIDGTDIQASIKFSTSDRKEKPRLLGTVTTTVANPVCYRYDSGTSSWTTTGVTTVDNGSTVSCSTSLPGAIMVQYVQQTTTTTTPDEASNVGLIVGLVVGLVVIAVAITLIIIFVKKAQRKKKQRRQAVASTPMFIEDNAAEIKAQKSTPDVQTFSNQRKISIKGVTTPGNFGDASVTEIRPMAADDSFEKPIDAPIETPMGIVPAGRSSYAKIESADSQGGQTDNELLKTPQGEVLPFGGETAQDNMPLHSSPELKVHVPKLLPEEDNIPVSQPDFLLEKKEAVEELPNQPDLPIEPKEAFEEPSVMSQGDAGSEHGSGKKLLGGVPDSDLIVEDAE